MANFKSLCFAVWVLKIYVLTVVVTVREGDACDASGQAVTMCRHNELESRDVTLIPDTDGVLDVNGVVECYCLLETQSGRSAHVFVSTTGWRDMEDYFFINGSGDFDAGFQDTILVSSGEVIGYQKDRHKLSGLCLNIGISETIKNIDLNETLIIKCVSAERTNATNSSSTVKPLSSLAATTMTDLFHTSTSTNGYPPSTMRHPTTHSALAYSSTVKNDRTKTNDTDKSNSGFIIGIVGAFVCGVFVSLLVVYVLKRRQWQEDNDNPNVVSYNENKNTTRDVQCSGEDNYNYIHPINGTEDARLHVIAREPHVANVYDTAEPAYAVTEIEYEVPYNERTNNKRGAKERVPAETSTYTSLDHVRTETGNENYSTLQF